MTADLEYSTKAEYAEHRLHQPHADDFLLTKQNAEKFSNPTLTEEGKNCKMQWRRKRYLCDQSALTKLERRSLLTE